MDKIYFHIYKGKPLSQEDNREEVPELHILVRFSAPEIHAKLMDAIDGYIKPHGEVVEYAKDMHNGHGIIDIAFIAGISDIDAIPKVKKSIEAYCSRNNYPTHFFIGKPAC